MHLQATMDGDHTTWSPLGEAWSPHWQVDQPTATPVVPPARHDRRARLPRLAGPFYVDDAATDGLLPSEHGVDDLPLIVHAHAMAFIERVAVRTTLES